MLVVPGTNPNRTISGRYIIYIYTNIYIYIYIKKKEKNIKKKEKSLTFARMFEENCDVKYSQRRVCFWLVQRIVIRDKRCLYVYMLHVVVDTYICIHTHIRIFITYAYT